MLCNWSDRLTTKKNARGSNPSSLNWNLHKIIWIHMLYLLARASAFRRSKVSTMKKYFKPFCFLFLWKQRHVKNLLECFHPWRKKIMVTIKFSKIQIKHSTKLKTTKNLKQNKKPNQSWCLREIRARSQVLLLLFKVDVSESKWTCLKGKPSGFHKGISKSTCFLCNCYGRFGY